jgi:catechol 2,3-dioxygenase-like lactoylglutathione lyase family enzyme
MRILDLNHVAILVSDVDRSRKFYQDVLGLEPIPRPAFDFPGAWFRIGAPGPDGKALQELHLIGRRPETFTRPRDRHFAFRVDSIAAVEERLRARGVNYAPPKKRPDGATQIFLEDPDGHAIELFTPPGA